MNRIMRGIGLGLVLSVTAGAAGDLPTGWYPIGDQSMEKYRMAVGRDWGYNGAGVRVYSTDATSGNFGGIGQAVAADNYRGKKIELTAMVRTIAVEGYAGLWIRVDTPGGNSILDNMQDRGIDGTTEWQSYSAVLYVPPDASRVLFGALLNGKGEFHVDEFQLQVVPDDTPETRVALPREPRHLNFD